MVTGPAQQACLASSPPFYCPANGWRGRRDQPSSLYLPVVNHGATLCADHTFTEARMTGRLLGSVLMCGVLAAGASLQAHHSLAGVYDMKAEKDLSGSVESVRFVNPHGSLTVGVKNPDGTTTSW